MSLLGRADELLAGTHADGLADGSDLLPAGLTRRLASLAGTLRAALAAAAARPANPDAPQIPGRRPGRGRAGVDQRGRAPARRHRRRAPPAFHAAVRLARWLAAELRRPARTSLPALLGRHGDSDAWVDSAVNDAAPGVERPRPRGRARRRAGRGAGPAGRPRPGVRARRWPRTPAATPAPAGTPRGVRHLEDLLPAVVLPLARSAPVLLLVLDGMSAGVGTEIIDQRAVPGRGRLGRGTAARADPPGRGAGRAAHAHRGQPGLAALRRAARPAARTPSSAATEALTRAHRLPGAALVPQEAAGFLPARATPSPTTWPPPSPT